MVWSSCAFIYTLYMVMYGILVVVMILQAVLILQQDPSTASLMLLIAGLILYGGGVILWNFENQFCPSVQNVRTYLPSLLSPVTQLHGWWHIMAGYATYMNIQFSVYHRLKYLQSSPTYSCDWIGVTVTTQKLGGKL